MASLLQFFFFGLCLSQIAAFGTNCGSRVINPSKVINDVHTRMQSDLKVAFLGDQNLGDNPKQVLKMIRDWGAHMVIHSGDLDYHSNPKGFEEQVNEVLGEEFPYFVSIGNHDIDAWESGRKKGYADYLVERLKRIGATDACTGEVGVNMVCTFKGISFVLSGVGTRGKNHAQFIDDSFTNIPSAKNSVWKFCSWHKNQRDFQIGGKSDEVGYEAYDTCRKHGAIIATGHKHCYSRTHLMADFERREIAHTLNHLTLKEGHTFAFVSGVGGTDVSSWDEKLIKNPWWAAYGADNNGLKDGALLCTLFKDGNMRDGECFFKDRKGKEWDRFTMHSENCNGRAEIFPKSRVFELSVQSSEDDFVVKEDNIFGERFDVKSPNLVNTDDRNASIVLQFHKTSLHANSDIRQVRVQVMGAGPVQVGTNTGFSIRVAAISKDQVVVSRSIEWTRDDEDWEMHSVWVSPDLSSLFDQVLRESTNWCPHESSLAVMLSAHETKRMAPFLSYDHSACVAPSLYVELGI